MAFAYTIHTHHAARVIYLMLLAVNARSLAIMGAKTATMHFEVSMNGLKMEYLDRTPKTVPTGHIVLQ